MVNRLWGKTPNVLEQRLLVALYQAGRPMTQSEILELATRLGLMNVTSNLVALADKGLVVKGAKGQMSLTPGGSALTKVGLEHSLFATPKEFADLVNKPAPQPTSEPNSAQEEAAQRIWERETSRAESFRLAQSPKLTSALRDPPHRNEPLSSTASSAPPVTPPRAVETSAARGVVVSKSVAEPTKPVIEETKPKVTDAPAVKVSTHAIRRPPPPPPRFRK